MDTLDIEKVTFAELKKINYDSLKSSKWIYLKRWPRDFKHEQEMLLLYGRTNTLIV